MPFEVPSSWVWCELGSVNEIARGGSPRPIKDYLTDATNGINWIKIGDTKKDGKYIDSVKEKIIPEGVKKSRMVHKGDFLLTNSMSFGRPYILNVDGCIHDGWLVISPLGKVYTSDFLYYLLSSSFAFEQFTNVASGGVVTNLNSDKVASTKFPLPPYEEQKRIVLEIEHWFALIDIIEHSKVNLQANIKFAKTKVLDLAIHGKLVPQDPTDEPASELLKRINPKAEITSDNGHYQKLPEGWCMTNIGSLFDAVSAKRVLKSEWKDKGVPFYRAREIVQLSKEGFADKDLFISEKHYAEIKDKYGIPTYGDIMISAVGSIGYTYIVKEDDVFYYKDASVLCLKNTKHWNSKFFSIWLASPFLQEQMYKNSKGTTVDTITLEKLKEYAIPFPPLNEQHRIVAKIEEIFAQLDAIEASL